MKVTKISTLIFAIMILSQSAAAQRVTLIGKVVDVIDSKTIVIKTSQASLKVQLQFIEPPEFDQPMADIVKEHLTKLVKDKDAAVSVRTTLYSLYIARVAVDGVDISAQLLRDGAAWYSVPNAPAQDSAEREEYLEMEKLARTEKRGIWAVDLTPAWELRLAREAAEQEAEEKEAMELAKKRASGALASRPYLGMSLLEFSLTCPVEAKDRVRTTYDVTRKPYSTYVLGFSEKRSNFCIGAFEFYGRILTRVEVDSQ